MHIVLSLVGIVLSFVILKYRERVGEMIGEAEWMNKVGGIYNLLIIVSILLFFWSVAELTGTTGIFFRPLFFLIPGAGEHMQEGVMLE